MHLKQFRQNKLCEVIHRRYSQLCGLEARDWDLWKSTINTVKEKTQLNNCCLINKRCRQPGTLHQIPLENWLNGQKWLHINNVKKFEGGESPDLIWCGKLDRTKHSNSMRQSPWFLSTCNWRGMNMMFIFKWTRDTVKEMVKATVKAIKENYSSDLFGRPRDR